MRCGAWLSLLFLGALASSLEACAASTHVGLKTSLDGELDVASEAVFGFGLGPGSEHGGVLASGELSAGALWSEAPGLAASALAGLEGIYVDDEQVGRAGLQTGFRKRASSGVYLGPQVAYSFKLLDDMRFGAGLNGGWLFAGDDSTWELGLTLIVEMAGGFDPL